MADNRTPAIGHRKAQLLATIAVIAAIIGACAAIYGMKTAQAGEAWKMEIHYTVTDEKLCAHFDFDTKDSCERAKDWFVAQAAWHGKNRYQCILESQCTKH